MITSPSLLVVALKPNVLVKNKFNVVLVFLA